MKVGNFSTSVVISTWLAASTGPVRTEVDVTGGGQAKVITTSELLKFSKGFSQADGS
jgi:hypothetical protein